MMMMSGRGGGADVHQDSLKTIKKQTKGTNTKAVYEIAQPNAMKEDLNRESDKENLKRKTKEKPDGWTDRQKT